MRQTAHPLQNAPPSFSHGEGGSVGAADTDLPPNLAMLVTHVPSLLLLSRVRVYHMQACIMRVLLLLTQVGVTYMAYPHAPALAFALSLHFACFFLGLAPVSYYPLIGDDMDHALRSLCIAALLLGCWRHGPPLPFRDVFGYSGGCGAQAHLLETTTCVLTAAWPTHQLLNSSK
jgi:hypothetical protein